METLTICKLLASPRSYAGQVVTLEATVVANFEFSALTDDSCRPTPIEVDGKHPLTTPHFEGSSYNPTSPLVKKLEKLLKRETKRGLPLSACSLIPDSTSAISCAAAIGLMFQSLFPLKR